MMKSFVRFIVIVLLLAATAGCAVNNADIRGFNLVSVEEEKQLGTKFAGEVEKQHKVVADPMLQKYVNRVGKRLLTGAREATFDFSFTAVQNDSINAFAIPGGHVYVHTGLIKAAGSEAELAGVMAHEINHAVARHGTRMLTQQYGYSLVTQLVLGQNSGMLTQLAVSLFGKAGQMAYSRGMENQADYLAVETMHRAGYNPEALVTFFQKLDNMKQRDPGTLERFFSSHPVTSERIRDVKNEILKMPRREWPVIDETEFRAVKAKLK